MATALEEITGGVPKAPRPPSAEDVLGPPPHAPHIGGRGKALARVQPLRRPPSAPRIGHRVESADSRQAAQRPQPTPPPQRVVIEDKRVPQAPEIIRDAGRASSEQLYRPAKNLGGTKRMKSERAKKVSQAAAAGQAVLKRNRKSAAQPAQPQDTSEYGQRLQAQKEALARMRKPRKTTSDAATNQQAAEEAERFGGKAPKISEMEGGDA